MKRMSWIRYFTYGIVVAIGIVGTMPRRFLPVTLHNAESVEAAQHAEAEAQRRLREMEFLVSFRGFMDSRHSGAELMRIGAEAAADRGLKLSEFHHPDIKVRLKDGRVQWVLYFTRNYGPLIAIAPAEIFSVTIDDLTGEFVVRDETAMM